MQQTVKIIYDPPKQTSWVCDRCGENRESTHPSEYQGKQLLLCGRCRIDLSTK